jgi:hypothetical protein
MRWRFSHGQTEFKTYVGATLTLVIGCFISFFINMFIIISFLFFIIFFFSIIILSNKA